MVNKMWIKYSNTKPMDKNIMWLHEEMLQGLQLKEHFQDYQQGHNTTKSNLKHSNSGLLKPVPTQYWTNIS